MSSNFPSTRVGDTGFTPKAGHKVTKAEVFRVESPQGSGYNEGGESPLLPMPLPVIQILVSSGPASEDCLGC